MRWVVIPQLTYIPIIINRQKLGMGTYMTEHIGFFTLSPYFLSLVAPIFLDFRFYIPLTYQQSLFPTYFFFHEWKKQEPKPTPYVIILLFTFFILLLLFLLLPHCLHSFLYMYTADNIRNHALVASCL